MELIKETKFLYIFRLNYGEELKGEIEKFCVDHSANAGSINVVGSANEIELAFYGAEKNEYNTRVFKEPLEILTITGNVSIKEGKQFLHAHGVFGRPSMEVIGGHIMRCIISYTCEVYLTKIEGSIERKYDEVTGLYLMCPNL